MKIYRLLVSFLLVGVLFVGGCTTSSTGQETANSSPIASSPTNPSPAQTAPTQTVPVATTAANNVPEGFRDLPRLDGQATVELVVKGAPIVIEVDGTHAPLTAGNFVDLVNRGFYNELSFHRVVRDPQPFVVQGGDPQSKDPNISPGLLGTGGFVDPATNSERYIPLEIMPQGTSQPIYGQIFRAAGVTVPPELRHTRGAVAMARSQIPDSASSQFYITLADQSILDGSYAVFGYVTSGMDVVDQIQQGDRISTAKVTAGLENLKEGS
jgi:peptidyl-prolyl cis-trans isomerase B (cyclophilin B)